MHLSWLEPSEEDLLVYTVGNEDDMNQNEEQRLRNLANGSNDSRKLRQGPLVIYSKKLGGGLSSEDLGIRL